MPRATRTSSTLPWALSLFALGVTQLGCPGDARPGDAADAGALDVPATPDVPAASDARDALDAPAALDASDAPVAPDVPVAPDAPPSDVVSLPLATIVGYADAPQAEDVVVRGSAAYVTGKENGLYVYDVSDPAHPVLARTVPVVTFGDQAWDLWLAGTTLYVSERAGGVRVFDVGPRPLEPAQIGRYNPGWDITQVVVDAAASRAYVAGGTGTDGRVEALDVRDPAAIRSLGAFTQAAGTNRGAASLAVRNTTLYYGQNEGTLRVLDAADPAAIREVASYHSPETSSHWALGLFVAGDELYMADWGTGMLAFSLADPARVAFQGRYTAGIYAHYDVWASATRAYVASQAGLSVVDVSDPTRPREVAVISARLERPGIVRDDMLHGVWVQGTLAYVADNGEQTLTVLSVREP